MEHIFLIGLPGSGKTTVAKRVSAETGIGWRDLDKAVTAEAGMTIPDIFTKHGEPHFRQLEASELIRLLGMLDAPTLIATGGGAPCFGDNMARMLQHGKAIWLDPPLEVLAKRLTQSSNRRPMFEGLNEASILTRLAHLHQTRSSYYRQAQVHITASTLETVQAAVVQVVRAILPG